MPTFGRQAIALLDHAGVKQAVIGGTSLGANVTLEAAAAAPERVKGMLIEMPVLDNALLGCAIAFTPLLVGLTFGAPVARLLGRGARLVPRGGWLLGDMMLDWIGQDPKPSASVLQGLFFGRVAPPRDERREDDAGDARDRPLPRPDPPVLRLRHARARAAERAPAAGLLDPGAAAHAGAADERDRGVHRALLQARAEGRARRRAPSGARRGTSTRRPSA